MAHGAALVCVDSRSQPHPPPLPSALAIESPPLMYFRNRRRVIYVDASSLLARGLRCVTDMCFVLVPDSLTCYRRANG
eukprot:scaffold225720_cov37-Tisochrysis_lutea.AAC.2